MKNPSVEEWRRILPAVEHLVTTVELYKVGQQTWADLYDAARNLIQTYGKE
jgi:hypothetical protein